MAEGQAYQPRLKKHYNTVVRDALKEKFNLANTMQVPAVEKMQQWVVPSFFVPGRRALP